MDVTLAIEFKFISWNNQSLHRSGIMCWLQPQILRHFTALRPERKIWNFSQVVWVIRSIAEYLPVLFGGSEIINLMCCLGNQKFWILSCVLGGSDILNPLLYYLGDQKFWTSPVLFGGSEFLNILLCSWGIRNSESPVLFGGVRNSESSPVFLGDQKLWISCVVWGVRNSESPVLFGDQKFWILSCGFRGSEILNPLLR